MISTACRLENYPLDEEDFRRGHRQDNLSANGRCQSRVVANKEDGDDAFFRRRVKEVISPLIQKRWGTWQPLLLPTASLFGNEEIQWQGLRRKRPIRHILI